MTQPADVPADPLAFPTADPSTPSSAAPPTYVVDDAATRAGLEDLQLQEEVMAQVLDVLDEAGRVVAEGAPRWVDPDVFGGSREGERMARHTIRAQVRVQEALDLALRALASHQMTLTGFRDEVRRVEAVTVEELAAVRARAEGVNGGRPA